MTRRARVIASNIVSFLWPVATLLILYLAIRDLRLGNDFRAASEIMLCTWSILRASYQVNHG